MKININIEIENKKIYFIFGIMVISLFLILVGFIVYNKVIKGKGSPVATQNIIQELTKKGTDQTELSEVMGSGRACTGQQTVEFGALPMKLEDIATYVPYGLMVGGHVTPIDHSYFYPSDFNSARDAYPVFAPADGTIIAVNHRGDGKRTGHADRIVDEYQLYFEYSCGFYSYYDLLTSISPDLEKITGKLAGDNGRWTGRFPVKEGQEIGRIGGQTVDFAVYKHDVTKDFINPESYSKAERWKKYVDNPFKYFKEPLRTQLIAKNIRKVEPIEGKIDYDIEGRLSGNWFLEGTNGYAGAGNSFNYHFGHLAFAYDHIDPTALVISIGDFAGEAKQFAIKNNKPDPATVEIKSGLVKYELTQLMHYDKDTGEMWNMLAPTKNPGAKPNDYVLGVMLVQMLEDRKIKIEAFPNKTAGQASGFTSNAKIYVR